MNYTRMAEDVTETLATHNIKHYHLLGHSMGGKVAMAMAQQQQDTSQHLMRSLIVVDIAPRHNQATHLDIIKALQALDITTLKSRSDANQQLSAHIPEPAILQFLLKNLQRRPEGGYTWKLNLGVIADCYDELLLDPLERNTTPLTIPTLVIRGSISDYVSDADLQRFRECFTILSADTIDGAGHWPHASHTTETTAAITTFLDRQQPLSGSI